MENLDKTTLEIRKIPSHLNTIAHLNGHFSKFGTITNLKIDYDNDSEAALIQFSSNGEALAAYRSTEAVLNNRFIKVFWHSSNNSSTNNSFNHHQSASEHKSKDQTEMTADSGELKKLSIKDRLGGIAEKQASITNSAVNNLINSGLINSNTPNQLASLVMSTGSTNSKLVNMVTAATTVSKPVFNKALLKKQYTPAVSTTNTTANTTSTSLSTPATPTALSSTNSTATSTATTSITNLATTSTNQTNAKITTKLINSVKAISKPQPQPNKEKLMKKLELQKKRQEMLSTSIQQNRLLIEKLERAKTDAEKQSIRETVTLLSKQIKQLEEDIKRENAVIIEETNLQKSN